MRKVELGEVAEVFGGYAFKSKDFNEISGVPVIKISNIQDGIVSKKTLKEFLPENYLDDYENYQIRRGDILVALSGATTGKTGVYNLDRKSLLNQRVGLVRANKGLANQKYLSYYVSKITDDILYKAQGVAQPNISTKELAKFRIPLPTLSEQKAIVAKLDRAQRLINIDQEMLAKYDELIQSVFLEMFGDPVRNEKGWEVQKLKNVAKDIHNGIGKGKKYYGSGAKVANIGDLYKSFEFKPVKYSLLKVSEKEIEKYSLNYGDLLFVRSSLKKEGVAVCSFYNSDETCLFSSFMIKVSPNLKILNPLFLSIQMRNPVYRKYIVNASNTATITNINQKALRNLDIIVPPMDLQNNFASKVNDIGREKEKTNNSIKKSEELFSSLVQEVFG